MTFDANWIWQIVKYWSYLRLYCGKQIIIRHLQTDHFKEKSIAHNLHQRLNSLNDSSIDSELSWNQSTFYCWADLVIRFLSCGIQKRSLFVMLVWASLNLLRYCFISRACACVEI